MEEYSVLMRLRWYVLLFLLLDFQRTANQGGFVSMAAGAPTVAASYLGLSTLLSFAQGFTTTAAIGGADMRELYSFKTDCDRAKTGFSCCYMRSQFVLRICSCCRRYSSVGSFSVLVLIYQDSCLTIRF